MNKKIKMVDIAKKFNLTWHNFMSNGKGMLSDLLETKRFSDVTLVSDDLYQYKAHKFILSSCSSVFQTILDKNPLNTSVYLRGIRHEEIESILQFIYLGEAILSHERMDEFMKVSKELHIKDIDQVESDWEDEKKDDLEINNTKVFEESSAKNESIEHDSLGWKDFVQTNSDNMYTCKYCAKILTSKSGIYFHIQSVHNKIRYNCPQCSYQGTTAGSLQRHIQVQHEGVKYPCDQCNVQFTRKDRLKNHIIQMHSEK